MPTPTYRPLATVTLGSTAASVTFSSIPATYRDLIVVLNGTGVSSGVFGLLGRLNGDTGSNYSTVRMFGTGSGSGTSDSSSGTTFTAGAVSDSTINTVIIQVMDYSATDKHKTILTRNSSSASSVNAHAARYASTSAITSITVLGDTTSLAVGYTASLYGVIA
jgi:hypothetical protein